MSKQSKKMCTVYRFPTSYYIAPCIIFFSKADQIDGFFENCLFKTPTFILSL